MVRGERRGWPGPGRGPGGASRGRASGSRRWIAEAPLLGSAVDDLRLRQAQAAHEAGDTAPTLGRPWTDAPQIGTSSSRPRW